MPDPDNPFVSRGGLKLAHALRAFSLDVTDLVCADLGCSTGGFTDCLLQHGAGKVYAVDTGYGVLDWKLRKDPRVVVMERTNALHVSLPERVDVVTIDASWTKQRLILVSASRLLPPGGRIVTLVKPHYEAAPRLLRKGVLPPDHLEPVLQQVRLDIADAGFVIAAESPSPILGGKGNSEVLMHLQPRTSPPG